jgi:cytidylate kinase-like protein
MAEESNGSTSSRAVGTLSASYGAGGSVVGSLAAERLGVPFLDRAIPSAVAERLGVALEAVLAREHRL